MQAITQYKAADGSIWNKAADAIARDMQHEQVTNIMARIGAKRHYSDFSRGYDQNGYVQHDLITLRNIKAELIALSRLHSGYLEGRTDTELMSAHPSWFHRIIDDSSPLSNAWSRMCSIDDQGREWGQAFFAYNPDNRGDTFEIQ